MRNSYFKDNNELKDFATTKKILSNNNYRFKNKFNFTIFIIPKNVLNRNFESLLKIIWTQFLKLRAIISRKKLKFNT